EDGIRDGHVTGVQTCALLIFSTMSITSDCWIWGTEAYWPIFKGRESRSMGERSWATITSLPSPRPPLQPAHQNPQSSPQPLDTQIGRASSRASAQHPDSKRPR